MTLLFLFVFLGLTCRVEGRAPLSIRIGGVFGEGEKEVGELILPLAVKRIQLRKDVLNDTRIDTYLRYPDSSLLSSYTVTCEQLEQSVLALFSGSPGFEPIIAALGAQYNIPHFSTDVQTDSDLRHNSFSVYLAPTREDITGCVLETVLRLGVDRVGVVSHSATGVLQTGGLVESLQTLGLQVLLLDLADKDIRPDLVKLRVRGYFTCVVDVDSSLASNFIKQAMQAGLVNSQSTFIFTTLDFVGINFEFAKYSGASILGLSINKQNMDLGLSQNETELIWQSYRAGILLDSISLFAHGLQNLSLRVDPQTPRVSCSNGTEKYPGGQDLLASLQQISFNGVTGPVSLQGGMRKEVSIHVLALDSKQGLREVGLWSRDPQGSVLRGEVKLNLAEIRSETEEVLVLVSEKRSPLAESILDKVGLKYGVKWRRAETAESLAMTEVVVYWDQKLMDTASTPGEGSQYTAATPGEGSQYTTATPGEGSQNTVVYSEPMSSTVPVSVEDFYIVYKAESQGSWFSWTTLACGLVSLITCSVSLSLTSRISPYQRRLVSFSLQESLWITLCGLLFRTWNFHLQGVSSRFVSLVWWIFSSISLILALVFLVRPEASVSLQSILGDPDFTVQTLENSSLLHYLQRSPDGLERTLARRDHFHLKTLKDGLDRVSKQDKVALLLERSQLLEVGSGYQKLRIGRRPQAYSLSRGSVWVERLNAVIVSELTQPVPEDTSGAVQLEGGCSLHLGVGDLYYYGAGFAVLGSIFAFLLSLSELVVYSARRSRGSGSWWKHICQEMKEMGRDESPDERSPRVVLTHSSYANSTWRSPTFSNPASPEKTGHNDLNDEATVTDSLLMQKAFDNLCESSRL